MKKSLLILLLLFLLIFPAFADEGESPSTSGASSSGSSVNVKNPWNYKGVTDRMPSVLSGRVMALGNTGTVLSTGVDALYLNPANLARNKKLFLDTPMLNIQIQPFAPFLESIKSFESNDYMGIIQKLLPKILSQGNNPVLLNVNAGIGMTLSGFGGNLFVDYGLFSNLSSDSSSVNDARIYPMFTVGATFGYGGNVYNKGLHRIDIGGSISLMLRTYGEGYTANDILNKTSSSNGSDGGSGSPSIMDILVPFANPDSTKRAMATILHPITIGMTYTFMNDLSVSLAIRDLWPSAVGAYEFDNMQSALTGIWSSNKRTGNHINYGFFDTGSLDIGIAYNPKWKWFNPRVELDFVDLYHYSDAEKKDFKYFFGSHMRLGIEAFVGEFLALRFGVDGGRLSFGGRLDLWAFVLDVSYGWKEWGEYAGAKPVDYFSIVIKFGWDRTK